MGNIIILDEHTSNNIAAGEVIERPASVVKELIENAVDANATQISIEIKNGGISYIRVSDNGDGFYDDDVEAAFERHATSKIRKADDLERVVTLGFRGEALPSIASVSKLKLSSRRRGSDFGRSIEMNAGRMVKNERAGAPVGTSIVVEGLFFNTPARYKFLKSDTAEAGAISSMVGRLAISRPDISFRLKSSGASVIYTPGNSNLKDAIYGVFGKNVIHSMIKVDYLHQSISVSGFAGGQDTSRGNRSFQLFYVNGRYVKNKVLYSATDEAYKTFLMKNRFAVLILNINMPRELVDVNAHPAKTEVRFSNESDVFRSVYHAIVSALRGDEMKLAHMLKPEGDEGGGAVSDESGEAGKGPGAAVGDGGIGVVGDEAWHAAGDEVWRAAGDEVWRAAGDGVSIAGGGAGKSDEAGKGTDAGKGADGAAGDEACRAAGGSESSVFDEDVGALDGADINGGAYRDSAMEERGNSEYFSVGAGAADTGATHVGAADTGAIDVDATHVGAADTGAIDVDAAVPSNARYIGEFDSHRDGFGAWDMVREDDGAAYDNSLSSSKIIGQLFGVYILLENGDNLIVVDQHACHERILYEELKKQAASGAVYQQMLIVPEAVGLSPDELVLVNEERDFIERTGFSFEEFGSDTILLRSVPIYIQAENVGQFFLDMLELVKKSRKKSSSLEEAEMIFDETLYSIACRAAIKANKKMNERETTELLRRAEELQNIHTCPHGRPMVFIMHKREFEKRFKRIV